MSINNKGVASDHFPKDRTIEGVRKVSDYFPKDRTIEGVRKVVAHESSLNFRNLFDSSGQVFTCVRIT